MKQTVSVLDDRAEGFDAIRLNYPGVINTITRILLEVTELETFDLHLRMNMQNICNDCVVAEFFKNNLSHTILYLTSSWRLGRGSLL